MKKPFGQHFLFDPNILRKIVRCSGIGTEDTVIEIGPGLGTLTGFLAGQAKKVIAIEFDRKLIDRLEDNMREIKNIEIVRADGLKFNYETIQGTFRVVANIPYYITTPLIFRLLEFRKNISSMTLLMQKEVARRIVASPGSKEYGALSIPLQLYTKPEIQFTVSRKAFSPPPSIDSAVVHFTVRPSPLFPLQDEDLFSTLVKSAFSQRRKTILNSLKKLPGIENALSDAGIDPGIRPEQLSVKDFVMLANALTRIVREDDR